MQKDTLLSILRISVGGLLFSYLIYLFINHADILPTKPWNYDIIVYVILGILAFMMILAGIMKFCFKRPRTTQIIMGIFIILFANYIGLEDNPSNYIFLKDILNVLGTIITILGFTKVCIYDKCQKKQEETEIEIIEV